MSFIEDKVNPKLFIEKSQDFIRNIDSYTFDNIFPPQARGSQILCSRVVLLVSRREFC